MTNLSDFGAARQGRVLPEIHQRYHLVVYGLLMSVVFCLLSASVVVGQGDNETAWLRGPQVRKPDLPAGQPKTVRQYLVRPVYDKYQRTEIARTGAAIDAVGSGWVIINANEDASAAVADLGYSVQAISPTSGILAFPDYDSEYHDYAEMVAELAQAALDHPDIVELFSIGKSYEGRDLWMAKVSDNPALDEAEPEILFSAHQHGKEHLSVEQVLYILRVLTDEYHLTPQIRYLVNSREIFILFDVNPDGGEYDHSGGYYHDWRKNRQPNSGSPDSRYRSEPQLGLCVGLLWWFQREP